MTENPNPIEVAIDANDAVLNLVQEFEPTDCNYDQTSGKCAYLDDQGNALLVDPSAGTVKYMDAETNERLSIRTYQLTVLHDLLYGLGSAVGDIMHAHRDVAKVLEPGLIDVPGDNIYDRLQWIASQHSEPVVRNYLKNLLAELDGRL